MILFAGMVCEVFSGGISSMDDIMRLDDLGLKRVIVGKAIYEGHITLKQIEHYISTRG